MIRIASPFPHLCSWATHCPSGPDITALKKPAAGTIASRKHHLLGKMLHKLLPASPVPLVAVQASSARARTSRTAPWTQKRAGAGTVEESYHPQIPSLSPHPGTHGHRWGSSAEAQRAGAGWQGSPPGWDIASGDSEGWEAPQAAATTGVNE